MKIDDIKNAIEFNIKHNDYKDGGSFRFASYTLLREHPPLYIAVDVSEDCYSLDFQNGYNEWTKSGCVEDYNKSLEILAKKLYDRLIEEGLVKKEEGIKVNITFLEQRVCDYYDFIPKPGIGAIRPSVEEIDLIYHTEKAIRVNVDDKDYWIAKSLIRSISKVEDDEVIFENEPFFQKYIDKIEI